MTFEGIAAEDAAVTRVKPLYAGARSGHSSIMTTSDNIRYPSLPTRKERTSWPVWSHQSPMGTGGFVYYNEKLNDNDMKTTMNKPSPWKKILRASDDGRRVHLQTAKAFTGRKPTPRKPLSNRRQQPVRAEIIHKYLIHKSIYVHYPKKTIYSMPDALKIMQQAFSPPPSAHPEAFQRLSVRSSDSVPVLQPGQGRSLGFHVCPFQLSACKTRFRLQSRM